MSDIAKDRTAHLLKKRGSVSSLSNHEFRRKEPHGRTKDSVSTVSYMDEPCQPEDASRLTVHMENTYQLAEGRRLLWKEPSPHGSSGISRKNSLLRSYQTFSCGHCQSYSERCINYLPTRRTV